MYQTLHNMFTYLYIWSSFSFKETQELSTIKSFSENQSWDSGDLRKIQELVNDGIGVQTWLSSEKKKSILGISVHFQRVTICVTVGLIGRGKNRKVAVG